MCYSRKSERVGCICDDKSPTLRRKTNTGHCTTWEKKEKKKNNKKKRKTNAEIVERTYDWSHRSWVNARARSVTARSWSCSKRCHTGLTTRLRPTCDRTMLQSWANRRKNVRLIADVIRLVAEVGGDRNG